MTDQDFQRMYPSRMRYVEPEEEGNPIHRSFYNDSQYLNDAQFNRMYPGRVRFLPRQPAIDLISNAETDPDYADEGDEGEEIDET